MDMLQKDREALKRQTGCRETDRLQRQTDVLYRSCSNDLRRREQSLVNKVNLLVPGAWLKINTTNQCNKEFTKESRVKDGSNITNDLCADSQVVLSGQSLISFHPGVKERVRCALSPWVLPSHSNIPRERESERGAEPTVAL